MVALYWFRQDLRLSDNPALYTAVRSGEILPIYILDDINAGEHKMGAASRWWLHHSLNKLNQSLEGKLNFYAGDPKEILPLLIEKFQIKSVFWNRCYEPWRIKRDTDIKESLKEKYIEVNTYNASLLWEPWEIKNQKGEHYKVFTPFYRKGCLNAHPPHEPFAKPQHIQSVKDQDAVSVKDLELLPKINWHQQMDKRWDIGEEAAHKTLNRFLDEGIFDYKEGRNYPSKPNVSCLSPYLHFGEISPNQIWYHPDLNDSEASQENIACFRSELGWREFSYSLLYYYPDLSKQNLQKKFDHFPWVKNHNALEQWKRGQTGIPIVDAGMRELWQTGYMHNRVRMIVASFLIKNLLIDWREGESWFWDCLVDADLSSNSASWQWVAGCGADAAPYFRIFNPVTQSQKFDPEGDYIKQYVPELKNLAPKELFAPWEVDPKKLEASGVILGKTYPKPIVDLKASRDEALEAYNTIKG